MNEAALQVVNLSELDSAWRWLGHRFEGRFCRWQHCSSLDREWLPGALAASSGRWSAARAALAQVHAHDGPSLLVSHGPRPAAFWEGVAGRNTPAWAHLCYAFNFTTLPIGWRQRLYARALQRVDRFVVASRLEQQLYARHFDLDPARLVLQHWAIRPPERPIGPPRIMGRYLCALGSQGRDYRTLLQAMRRLPALRLVLVATADSVVDAGPLPDNVTLLRNIPRAEAVNVLVHAELMALPLQHAEVPCGQVTAAQAMHLGVPVVATDSAGLHDYLLHEVSALLVAPGDPDALARALQSLVDDPARRGQLAFAAQQHAQRHCSEDAAVACFEAFLTDIALNQA